MKDTNNTALVITSIAGPESKILMTYAKECGQRGIPFIVIGDSKSPDNFQLDNCDFWSLDRQKTLEFNLAPILPIGHYARKNLGYLTALKTGARTIVETDDDNYPLPDFWSVLERSRKVHAYDIKNQGWVNVYRYFSDEMIWPRGFPLEKIQEKAKDLSHFANEEVTCPIQQGLADENPDVDALYRLTYPLPIQFNKGLKLALGQNAWSPFNSQNTFWFREAMPLMYLPSYCNFRMTDIWRSFIAQRIAWENEWSVLYHQSTVWQERNDHSLLKDFEDEIPGYLNNQKIIDVLMGLKLVAGENAVCDNLIKCYDAMIDNGWVQAEEASLVRAWVEDISNV
jgi:hypothetical protein